MSDEEVEDSELEGMIGDIPVVDYDPKLMAARRESFRRDILRRREQRKKPCSLFVLLFLLIPTFVGLILNWIF